MVGHRENDILSELSERSAQAAHEHHRGAIVQPGAIGDCILTLPLAKFMKESLNLGGLDILGHTEYIGYMPERTCVDGVRSIDTMELHRLFVEPEQFDPPAKDPLIGAFADYSWIVSFMGEHDGAFEHNLIFTANCSHSAEVVMIELKPPGGSSEHVSSYYIRQFVENCEMLLIRPQEKRFDQLIEPCDADPVRGRQLLDSIGAGACARPVVIAPGSGGVEKCWHLDNFLTVANELRSQGVDVVFLLGPAELERFDDTAIKKIADAGPCLREASMDDVPAFLSCADGFVGNDSGITHLAGGIGARTFALFGPTDPALFAPIGPDVTILRDQSGDFAVRASVELQRKLLDALAC